MKKKPDVTFATKIKGTLLGEVKISEKDVDPFLEQLRIALLQTDVNFDVAEKIVARMRENMVGSRDQLQVDRRRNTRRAEELDTRDNEQERGIDVVAFAEERKARKETHSRYSSWAPTARGRHHDGEDGEHAREEGVFPPPACRDILPAFLAGFFMEVSTMHFRRHRMRRSVGCHPVYAGFAGQSPRSPPGDDQ